MKLGRKTLNKKTISVLIKNAQVIAFLKFCYRQLFGKSGWSVKKGLDPYQILHLCAHAFKGPTYQILA